MECGHDEMEYFTMQLRSADEGQTVSYRDRERDAPSRLQCQSVADVDARSSCRCSSSAPTAGA